MKANRIAAVALGVIVIAAGTVYVLAAREGFTVNNLLHASRVDITLFQADRNGFILTADDSIPLDACIHDGNRGDMYFFVQDCASRYPRLFAWSTSGEGRVRRGQQKLYGEKPGRFIISVRALGFTDSLAGEIVPAVSLLLSTYDTTLHPGEEIVVGSLLKPKTDEHVPVSSLELYDREQGNTIRLTRLDWAYPPAARIPTGGRGWSYSVFLNHPLSADGTEQREIDIDAPKGTVTVQEARSAPKFTYGPQARVQGDEDMALHSAVSCLTLHRARTGRVPPSLDSLVTFARALRDTTRLGTPLPGNCDYDALRFRAAEHGTPANSRVHESGLFSLRYTPRASGCLLVVRPLRYGETGVVSYRYEDPDGWRRTFENREPAPIDDYLDRDRRIWMVPGAKAS
jgi:hypothetical protein